MELRSKAEQTKATSEETQNVSEAKSEERSDEQRSEEKSEERSEVKVIDEPAPVLRVEDRSGSAQFHGLADAFEQRGFPASPASVTWDEFRTLSWSAGTVLTDVNPLRNEGIPLGADQRYVFPVFPSTAVDAGVTAVQTLRQSARTLAAGTAVVRPLDSTTTKPEVATTTELLTTQLKQVAAIETNVPEILGQQPLFQSLVENDLRLSIYEGYDRLVIDGVSTAGTISKGTADILTATRKALTSLQNAGYAGDTLAIDSAGAEALDLFRSSGSEAFYVWGPSRFAPGQVFGLNVRITKAAGTAVIASQQFGRLYSSPLQLQWFEVDAGATNRSNIRLEGHAVFAVERTSAAVRIMP